MSGRPDTEESSARSGIPLGRIAGVPVTLAWSWFVIAAFVVFAFGPDVGRALPGIGAGAYAVALVYAVLLLLSVLVHELAHARLAKAYGWPGARIVLTLWGGHTQFGSFNATPGRSLAVALAGPAANFIIAGLGLLAQTLLSPGGVVGLLLSILVLANFLVAVFNVLPGLPLDGGRLVESLVWRITGSQERGTIAAGWAGRIIAVGLVLAFVGWPLYRFGTVDFTLGIVGLLVAGFIFMGASASMRDARMRLRLPSLSAAALSSPAVGLRADATLADVVERGRNVVEGTEVVLVGAGGRPEAVIDPPSLASVPRDLYGTTPAASVARALAAGAVVREDAAGQPLVQYLASLKGSEYAVVDMAGTVTGLLRQETVVRAITGR
ncbi:site-2 protease family protein [Zhihengliuella halotolerans]|uniref:site-2 protease family protein n=1 Tax=Zhihengliuella halotolerans TaxID=370736 RepID=UPI000C802730|nr:site-2 protease family protein [Zhihengliuella halotolerans]